MELVSNVDVAEIRSALQRILQSQAFQKAKRSQRFLSYLVDAAITVPPVSVNEYAVALDVFDRPASYDPSVDATVRVEAGRLRGRLREYYAGEGQGDKVLIDIPKGRYAVEFSRGVSSAPAPGGMMVDPVSSAAPESTLPQSRPPAGEQASRTLVSAGSHPLRLALALLVCLAGVAGLEVLHQKQLNAGPSIHSMAVLPLRNLSGSPDQNYLAEGMTDELNAELAQIPHLRVISHDSVMSARLNGKPLRQIGKELGVDAIVEGSVFRFSDKVRITAQLTDTRNDRQVWAANFEGNTNDLMALQDNVAQEIASHARLAFASGSALGEAAAQHHSPEAYDAYLRGRYFLDKRDPELSTRYFQQAIDLDPTLSSAYAGLAEAFEAAMTLGSARPEEVKTKALAAAHRAIELDARNGPAYSALGTIEFTQLWKWRQAEQDLARGMQLSPGDSFPLTMYGLLLDATQHRQDALLQMQQAVTMDPLSFFVSRNFGSALYYARRYDEALQQLNRAKELQPDKSQVVDNWISWTYEMKGMRDEAVQYDLASLQRRRSSDELASLRHTYQAGGWEAYWQTRLKEETKEPAHECSAYERSLDYLRLGDRDLAIAQLQQAYAQHCFWMEMIAADPRFDRLSDDPKFKALTRLMSAGQADNE